MLRGHSGANGLTSYLWVMVSTKARKSRWPCVSNKDSNPAMPAGFFFSLSSIAALNLSMPSAPLDNNGDVEAIRIAGMDILFVDLVGMKGAIGEEFFENGDHGGLHDLVVRIAGAGLVFPAA